MTFRLIDNDIHEKMESLAETAWELHKNQQYQQAVEIYGRALKIAETIADNEAKVRYQFRQGMCLHNQHKLHQALAVLAPILKNDIDAGDPSDIYNTLTTYIATAQNLPVSLNSIEKAYTKTEGFLLDLGYWEWRHEILCLKADLYAMRGFYRKALTMAQESWSLWSTQHPHYIADCHISQIISLLLHERDYLGVRRYLREWEEQRDELPRLRERYIARTRSSLARLEGRFDDAIRWARHSIQIGGDEDILVLALMSTGELERARDYLARTIWKYRHTETEHIRFETYILLGDFYLALVRNAVGFEAIDDDFEMELPSPTKKSNPEEAKKILTRTKKIYQWTENIGQRIDEKLKSNRRQERIDRRIKRINDIEIWL